MNITRLRAVFALLGLAWTPPVLAHGPAASASALLEVADGQASVVRVAGGLAQRQSDGFRFVCPEAWDGDVLAAAAAVPGGPVLIASERSFLMDAQGDVSPYPEEIGAGVALASNDDALFGLFTREGKRELRRLDAESSQLLHAFDESFSALAVGSEDAWLLGWSKNGLFLQRVALSGELRERMTWGILSTVARAELHLVGAQPYVSVWGSSAPWVSVGRIQAGNFEPLRDAHSNIGGPVQIEDGAWAVIDGALEPLDAQAGEGRDQDMSCLESVRGVPYVCANNGLQQVDARGHASVLFTMEALREPDYRSLATAEARESCNMRWLDLQVHLAGKGLIDAGAASGEDARAQAPADQIEADTPNRTASCALAAGADEHGWLCASVLALLALRTRRR